MKGLLELFHVSFRDVSTAKITINFEGIKAVPRLISRRFHSCVSALPILQGAVPRLISRRFHSRGFVIDHIAGSCSTSHFETFPQLKEEIATLTVELFHVSFRDVSTAKAMELAKQINAVPRLISRRFHSDETSHHQRSSRCSTSHFETFPQLKKLNIAIRDALFHVSFRDVSTAEEAAKWAQARLFHVSFRDVSTATGGFSKAAYTAVPRLISRRFHSLTASHMGQ